MTKPLHSFWFGRFKVFSGPNNSYLFRDMLVPSVRSVACTYFDGLIGKELETALFRFGFIQPCMPVHNGPVRKSACERSDVLFWQYPCLTEGAAWEQHANLPEPALIDKEFHIYLGLPWATWIDFARKDAWPPAGAATMELQLQMIAVRISGLRGALSKIGLGLRVHTVCQHIYWNDILQTWHRLGITDAWLSHYPNYTQTKVHESLGIMLHPWALFAVNVRDAQRRPGIVEGRDPSTKSVLASFVGAYSTHYLSDVRLRLRALADKPGFTVRVTDSWHFENIVYGEQIGRQSAAQANNDDVTSYNRLLSESVFSLCPAGAGANTLRLWESLAVGAVPILCGPQPVLPTGGNLPAIDWDSIVVRVTDDQIERLPSLLKAIPLSEIRSRQQRGMQAYALIVAQRCF